MPTKIEWTKNSDGTQGRTWNPISGCSRKSAGCENCYAEVMTKRLALMGQEKYQGLLNEQDRFNGTIKFDEKALLLPLKTKKLTTYFVNSMSDLFHENVKGEWIDKVFAAMALCPQHTFQILTKRADRMKEYLRPDLYDSRVNIAAWMKGNLRKYLHIPGQILHQFPLKNVWLGVSVENQKAADERIPLLLETPAAIRFLSCEPLLSGIEFSNVTNRADAISQLGKKALNGIDWVIVGGESGHGARPCDISWIQSIVDQCRSANVPCFVKQLGAYPLARNDHGFDGWEDDHFPEGTETEDWTIDPAKCYQGAPVRVLLKNRKGGDISEFPKDLQIRQMPR